MEGGYADDADEEKGTGPAYCGIAVRIFADGSTGGVMQTGRQVIGGEPYFFKDNGILDETAYDFSSVKAGDVIRFGVYEQDNDTANGPERIAWKVLEQDGTGVLLISESLLDCKKFHEQEEAVTWETCDLRAWLNKDFLSTAFNSGE